VAALPSGAPAAFASASLNVVTPREISKSDENTGLSFTRAKALRISSESASAGRQVFRKFTWIFVCGDAELGVPGKFWANNGSIGPPSATLAISVFKNVNFGTNFCTAGL
jgi:hypothetical protein